MRFLLPCFLVFVRCTCRRSQEYFIVAGGFGASFRSGEGRLPAERRGKTHLAGEEVGTEGRSTSRETRCAYHLSAPRQGAGLAFGDEARRRRLVQGYEALCIDRWPCYLLMANLITHTYIMKPKFVHKSVYHIVLSLFSGREFSALSTVYVP